MTKDDYVTQVTAWVDSRFKGAHRRRGWKGWKYNIIVVVVVIVSLIANFSCDAGRIYLKIKLDYDLRRTKKRGLVQPFASLHHLKKLCYCLQKSPRSVCQDGTPEL